MCFFENEDSYLTLLERRENELREKCNDLLHKNILIEHDLKIQKEKVAELTLELEKLKGEKPLK